MCIYVYVFGFIYKCDYLFIYVHVITFTHICIYQLSGLLNLNNEPEPLLAKETGFHIYISISGFYFTQMYGYLCT
jgi:hypothetical protein